MKIPSRRRPVAIELDQLIEELGALPRHQLMVRIASVTDHDATTPERRRDLLLDLFARTVELRGAKLTWTDRGLGLKRGGLRVVLGVSADLGDFLALRTIHDPT